MHVYGADRCPGVFGELSSSLFLKVVHFKAIELPFPLSIIFCSFIYCLTGLCAVDAAPIPAAQSAPASSEERELANNERRLVADSSSA